MSEGLIMLGACIRTVENPVNAHPTITTMKPGRRYMLQVLRRSGRTDASRK